MAIKKKKGAEDAPPPAAGMPQPSMMGMQQPMMSMPPGGMQQQPQPMMGGQPGMGMQQPMMGGMQPMQGMQQPMQGMQQPMQGMQPMMQQPLMQQPMMQQPMMGMPGGGYGMPQQGMQFGNPMAQLMQMMAAFGGGGMGMGMGQLPPTGQVDPSAQPFVSGASAEEQEPGLAADIVQPATIEDLLKEQQALPVQPVLDLLCLSQDGKTALGGLPRGCTIAFAGPPGKGKTRAMLEGIARVASTGMRCAYVVAEEGFRDEDNPGRDDLCSRFAKIAMAATGLDEAGLREKVLPNVLIIQSQYHKGHTWDDFIRRYRYVVEDQQVRFIVVDSLNTLDPTHARMADNLSVLKTYNHEHGVTCVTIGQIKDTGEPVGGEALMHTADAVFLIEELSLGSKEMAEFWGGKYREKVSVIQARKCVTTPVFPHPIRVGLDERGRLAVHPDHPSAFVLPTLPGA
jgi:RecA/RadA recombinase